MTSFLQNRIPNERIHRSSTTLIACTLCLARIVFGQTTNPATTDKPSPSEPMHTVIPVHLEPTTGDIKVGRTTYHGALNALHVLALSRNPNQSSLDGLDLIGDKLFTDAPSVNSFLQSSILDNSTNDDALLIVYAPGSNYGISISDISSTLTQFGGQVDLQGAGTIPFVFIGNGGRNQGGAFQRGVCQYARRWIPGTGHCEQIYVPPDRLYFLRRHD